MLLSVLADRLGSCSSMQAVRSRTTCEKCQIPCFGTTQGFAEQSLVQSCLFPEYGSLLPFDSLWSLSPEGAIVRSAARLASKSHAMCEFGMTYCFGRYRAVTAVIRATNVNTRRTQNGRTLRKQVSRPTRKRYSKRRRTVEDMIHALLVHDQEGPLRELELLLKQQGFHTSRARTCAAAKLALAGHQPPRLVFTDTVLPDGTWAEIVDLARRTHTSVPVILVSRLACVRLYLEALENGASDFIVPPFRDSDLAHIVRSATLRGGQATLAHSSTAGRTVGEGA